MIKIGKVGKIDSGDDAGSFIKVIDDAKQTGGFIILLSKSEKLENVFDYWVENEQSLKVFFEESNWLISWRE